MKKKYIIPVLFLLALITSSCVDLLNQEPTDSLSKKNFWKDEEDATAALAGVFSDTRYLFCRDYYLDGLGDYVKMRGNSFMSNNGNNGRAYMG